MIAVADFLYRLYHQLVSTHGLEADKNAAEAMKKLRQYAKENAESEEYAQGYRVHSLILIVAQVKRVRNFVMIHLGSIKYTIPF